MASASILVAGWEMGLGQLALDHPPIQASTVQTSSSASPPSASSSATTQTPTKQATPATGNFIGTSESTQYGNVQVQVTVSSGKITDVKALQLTDRDGRSVSISNRAAPILRQEILTAQTARVQTISGATYISDAYLTSLQSALDQAKL